MPRTLPYRRQVTSPGGRLFVSLLGLRSGLHFPHDVGRAIWAMIDASPDPEAQAFKYQLTLLCACVTTADKAALQEAMCRFLEEWLTPGLLRAALRELQHREEVPATVIARLCERLDAQTLRDGSWRVLPR